jgi:coatomer protein complex subunit alpha (xenin)
MMVWGSYLVMSAETLTLDAGPVRGVAFHPTRPLLATGGDDYKVKVWGVFI